MFYVFNCVIQQDVVVKAGFEYIINAFFHHEIPILGNVEHATNYIEDELMRNENFVNHDESLFTSNKVLADMLGVKNKGVFTRDDIELVFNKYADFIKGEPERVLEIEFSKEKFVIIYLIRDIMYYLKFKEITISL